MIKIAQKKPIQVKVLQWDGNNKREMMSFCTFCSIDNGVLKISTLEGVMTAKIGDYIIKGVNGEFYPCDKEIFEKTYSILD